MATIKGCEDNVEGENVVVIDLEDDSLSNVSMKMPKRSAKKRQGSKGLKSGKNFPLKAYIYIDDDDDDGESGGNHIPQKDFYPVKLSKSKRMYPGRGQLNDDDAAANDNDGKSVYIKNEGQSNDAIDGALVEGAIVNEKEMIKDTVEYKQAQDEELLARQLALKVQAEEAQQQRRLLKRKKAEKLRLLAIKKRQKQRLEEIRESQKQDEENMSKKEIYRIAVQQDLKKLEMSCHNMASLLYRLGILANGPYATSDQVHAAYKRALLRFHPDRACSGSDMRQQVEAEEKFKLISRMKERVSNIPSLK